MTGHDTNEPPRSASEARLGFAIRLHSTRIRSHYRGLGRFLDVTGIGLARWRQIEDGEVDPTIDELAAIAEALPASLHYLITGIDPQPGQSGPPPVTLPGAGLH